MEKGLLEELNRFRYINQYTKNLITEQELPPPDGEEELPAPGADELPPSDEALPPVDGEEMPPEDAGLDDGVADELPEPGADDTTEEIDITDLVNMTKNIKQDLDNKQDASSEVLSKMDALFQKIGELENRSGEMDIVIGKIEELGQRVEKMRPPTPVEKLEMRSLDSGPFDQKPQEFFNAKKPEMERSGKNEYVLTKNDVQNYSKNEIMKTFNPDINEY